MPARDSCGRTVWFTVEGHSFLADGTGAPSYLEHCLTDALYERPEREALRQFLDPGLPVIELGGCIGVVACITNKRLRKPSRHVVVEPNPDLLPVLAHNRAVNGCGFTIVHGAIGYGAEVVTLYRNAYFPASNTSRAWEEPPAAAVTVPTVTLRGILDRFGFERATVMCDIEGAECALVEHERDVLRQRVAMLVLEAHRDIAPEATTAMLRSLEEMRFRPLSSDNHIYAFQNPALWASRLGSGQDQGSRASE